MTNEARIVNGINALNGDAEAARRYLGSYLLVHRHRDGKLFRARTVPRAGYTAIRHALDDDGLLLPRYWSLPRLE